MLVLLIVNFYTTRVVLQSLGVDDFGLYNVVAGFVALIGFINQSMTNSIQRYLNFAMGKKSVELLRTYFSSAVYVQAIIAAIVFILAEIVGVWCINNVLNIPAYKYVAANIVFQISIISFVFKILETPFVAVIISHEKMDIYAIVSLVEGAMQLAIAFFINYIAFYRLEFYSLMLLILTIILSIVYLVYSKKIATFKFSLIKFDKNVVKNILSFSGWNLFGTISSTIKTQGINILMNLFFGVAVNAARGVAYQVLSGCLKFTSNFQMAVNPQIVKSFSAQEKSRYLHLTYMNGKASFFLMWLLVLPLSINIKEILCLWLGNGCVPEYTEIFIVLVLFTGLIDSLGSAISVSIYATGRIKFYQIIVSTITLLVLPISYIFYKIGYAPETSMYISLGLSFAAQSARVAIWSNLIKEPIVNYLHFVVLPIVVTIVISYGIAYLIDTIFTTNSILSIVLIITINLITIWLVGLDKNTRTSIKKAIISKLHTNGK